MIHHTGECRCPENPGLEILASAWMPAFAGMAQTDGVKKRFSATG